MTHLTIDQLTDHVLGLAAEETQAEAKDHLATGCQRCNRLHAMLVRIRRIGRFDRAHQPPAAALRTVKALSGFGHSRPRSRLVDMRLSFDSLLNPGLVGARSMHTSSRHLVFYSQDFALDLRMDSERSARDVVVVGQLLDRDWGPLSDVPAYLLSGDRVLSHSTTGRLGEFHMECRPAGPMHLQLAVADQELIDVQLDRRQPVEPRPARRAGEPEADQPEQVPPSIHSRSSDSAN